MEKNQLMKKGLALGVGAFLCVCLYWAWAVTDLSREQETARASAREHEIAALRSSHDRLNAVVDTLKSALSQAFWKSQGEVQAF
jgi:hypothetical protein